MGQADQGNAIEQVGRGIMYEKGRGVRRDRVESCPVVSSCSGAGKRPMRRTDLEGWWRQEKPP